MSKLVQTFRKRRGILTVLLVLVASGVFAAAFWGNKATANDFITAKAERGLVEVTVSATGTVQAVTTVQVGSQVSGTVAWLGADFNSQVKRGQVIARLDPSTFEAQVENARASVANAEAAVQAATTEIANQQANLQAAKANQEVARVQRDDAVAFANRYKELNNVVAGRDIESAQAQANVAAGRLVQATAQVAQAEAASQTTRARLEQARAQLSQAKAQLEQATVNLNHTVITSPIDGVVVSRSVDVGQTVAASLQAPTLFTIANDLTKMQVLASVDEADVGQVREGTEANFTVDAFPGETFTGKVSQIRLDAQTLQNVVTYTAVIEVANPELKLRPGMTANITFPVARRENVLTIPNAALRFKPNLSEKEQQELQARMQARRQERMNARNGEQAEGAEGRDAQPRRRRDAGAEQGAEAAGQGNGQRPQGQMVWVLTGEKRLEPRFVRTGLTNGRVTEVVVGNLQEGDIVVTGQNGGDNQNAQQTSSPFGRRPAGGMGGGFGGGRRR
ncbi:MAG TPA: efflux RND transporter periplasmic adaptor subunit [Blastocatellia bacterium]|nr:efflux RND transporter periplasmic adaptor subunit [Blastocatellia bacterium]